MKKWNAFAWLATIVLAASSISMTVAQSNAILESFDKMYPASRDAEWDETDDNLTVNFLDSSIEKEAIFDEDGNWIETKSNIPEDECPQNIRDYIEKNYEDFDYFNTITMIENSSSKRYYVTWETEDDSLSVVFDEDGNPLE